MLCDALNPQKLLLLFPEPNTKTQDSKLRMVQAREGFAWPGPDPSIVLPGMHGACQRLFPLQCQEKIDQDKFPHKISVSKTVKKIFLQNQNNIKMFSVPFYL